MSMAIMLSGNIAKQPETCTSKNGNPYTTATVRTQEGEDAMFTSITRFGDRCPVLLGLGKGDSILWSAPVRRTPTREGTATPESAYQSPRPR